MIALTGSGGAYGILTNPVAAVAAVKAAVPGYATSLVLGKIMTEPRWANSVVGFLKETARVAPGAALQIGQSVTLRDGRNVVVTDIYPDGSFDATPSRA